MLFSAFPLPRWGGFRFGLLLGLVWLGLCPAISGIARAQHTGLFSSPLDLDLSLAGNYGECRMHHFHAGLDLKTQGRENHRVYAAAEGYVSRIRVQRGGYGHALYINHPSGYTTVYAHLNDFAEPLQRYLRENQYAREEWEVDLYPQPGQFPVGRREFIAYSGNTGASQAPHLHFEIRHTASETPLNPLHFGLPIQDGQAPIPLRLFLYDRDRPFYDQPRRSHALQRRGDGYYPQGSDTLDSPGLHPGLGVEINDFMEGSQNTLNFQIARVYHQGQLLLSLNLDSIAFHETRYLHAYVDYLERYRNHRWVQLLFPLPGNGLRRLYEGATGPESLSLSTDPQAFRLEFEDAFGNRSSIHFFLRYRDRPPHPSCDSLSSWDQPINFTHPQLRFRLPAGSLYDSVCFSISSRTRPQGGISDHFQVHRPEVPVHQRFLLEIKPRVPLPFAWRQKLVLCHEDKGRVRKVPAQFNQGWYGAEVREFGRYWLDLDTTAPRIIPLMPQGADLSSSSRLRFRVEEEGELRSFRVRRKDGQWLLFQGKGKEFFYEWDEHCPAGHHELLVEAVDGSGNQRSLHYSFKR